MRTATLPACLTLCLALAASACASAPPAEQTITIAAAPWPLEWLAAQIAPDAEVRGLGQAGQDPHELDLRPAERELLDTADAILYLGPLGFQPQVEEAAAARGEAAVAVSEAAAEFLRGGEPEDHGQDDDAHAEQDDEHGEEHPVAGADPHLWFDPRALAAAAEALAERLATADPENADGYRERARAVARDLEVLHGELDAALSGCAQDTVLVGHEAFAYLLAPRGLKQVGISGVGGHGEASPARMAELTGIVRSRGISAVLTEPVEGREAAEALAREAGVALREVDTLESPPEAARDSGYPDLLRAQAGVFAEVLECGS